MASADEKSPRGSVFHGNDVGEPLPAGPSTADNNSSDCGCSTPQKPDWGEAEWNRRREMVEMLEQGIVPPGVEDADEPRIQRRFPLAGRGGGRFIPREARRGDMVRVTQQAIALLVNLRGFRTLRSVSELGGGCRVTGRRSFVHVDMVMLHELVRGTQAADVLQDLRTLRDCGAIEFGEEER